MAVLLLVDNDARIVELTAWFLERRGYHVRSAVSYAAARARISEEGPPDLMLADLELGVESGREELPRLSAQGALPPTLVVSGYLDADLKRELMALPNVLGTLPKPFDMPDLEAEIARCLALAAPASVALSEEGGASQPTLEAGKHTGPTSAEATPANAGILRPTAPPSATPPAALGAEDDEDEGWIEILPGALPPNPDSFNS